MDVKEAVQVAKQYLQQVFSDEQIKNVGLEEVEYLDQSEEWHITLGFDRPRELPGSGGVLQSLLNYKRSYKVLRISDKTRQILSMKNRETVE
jgi:hypothetical protein